MHTRNLLSERQFLFSAVGLVVLVSLMRLCALIFSALGLGGDEAQYWFWSQSFAWGYFSKPPLIGWSIGLSTILFGNTEWAIRLPAWLGHLATAALLGATAWEISPKKQLLAKILLIYLLMPGVWISSFIISTDSLLAPCVAATLLSLIKLHNRRAGYWWVVLCTALGLGLLAKYAVIYAFIGLALALSTNQQLRKSIFQNLWWAIFGLVIMLALTLPHFWWNWQNDFATVSHTAANANWDQGNPNFLGGFTFLIDQLGVFGPILFPLLLVFLVLALKNWTELEPTQRLLIFFILPPLVIIFVQASLSRAHANWAAMAYLPASLFLALHIQERWHKILLGCTVILHLLLGTVALKAATSLQFADKIGLANGTKRMRGWPETIALIAQQYDPKSYDLILVDDRMLYFELQYYGQKHHLPIKVWWRHDYPENHAELVAPLPDGSDHPILVVNMVPDYTRLLRKDFQRFTPVKTVNLSTSKGKVRQLQFFAAQGYVRARRDAAYEQDVIEHLQSKSKN